LLQSIDLGLQFGDTNQITLREPFTKLVPNVNSIFEEHDGLSNLRRNGIQDPLRNELIAAIPSTKGWIKCISRNGKSTVDEIEL
jgi:hypothetical protein